MKEKSTKNKWKHGYIDFKDSYPDFAVSVHGSEVINTHLLNKSPISLKNAAHLDILQNIVVTGPVVP